MEVVFKNHFVGFFPISGTAPDLCASFLLTPFISITASNPLLSSRFRVTLLIVKSNINHLSKLENLRLQLKVTFNMHGIM